MNDGLSEGLSGWLALEFFRRALLASLLASLLCGVVGTLVVLKRLVSLAGGLAHAAFGGLGGAFHFGLAPRGGAVLVALLCAVGLGFRRDGPHARDDAAIGVLWAVGMAIGMVFLHLTPGYAPNLLAYLFGNVLLVRPTDLWLAAATNLVILAALAFAHSGLVAVAFDEDQALLQGLPVRWYRTAWLVMLALSVVVLLQLVGIVLVMALLTIPPLIALRLARGLLAVILTACGVSLLVTVGGLCLSVWLDWPAGPVMVLFGALLLLGVQALPTRFTRTVRTPYPAEVPG